jgi:hypothetical protein
MPRHGNSVRVRARGPDILGLVRVEVSQTEHFPAVSVHLEFEELFGVSPRGTVIELSDEDAMNLRRARDEWHAWESRLLGTLDPGSPPAGFFS